MFKILTKSAVLAAFLALTACAADSIESLCDDAAEAQCGRCFDDCAGDGAPSGDVLCRVASGSNRNECVNELSDRCESQASTLEDPKDRVESCVDTLDRVTCNTIYGGWAQERRITTDTCEYFL